MLAVGFTDSTRVVGEETSHRHKHSWSPKQRLRCPFVPKITLPFAKKFAPFFIFGIGGRDTSGGRCRPILVVIWQTGFALSTVAIKYNECSYCRTYGNKTYKNNRAAA
jgi:hypothetical protein